jgi:branched-subunit amino acid transport protein
MTVWIVILAGVVGTVAFRSAGPLRVGGRELPDRMSSVIGLLAPALLAALVVYQTVADPAGGFALDERLAGVAAAAAALALRAPLLVVVVVAAIAAAGSRAV